MNRHSDRIQFGPFFNSNGLGGVASWQMPFPIRTAKFYLDSLIFFNYNFPAVHNRNQSL